jgi:hypothetical protein
MIDSFFICNGAPEKKKIILITIKTLYVGCGMEQLL